MDTNSVKGLMALLVADGSLTRYDAIGGAYAQMTLTAGVTEAEVLKEKAEEVRRFLPTRASIAPYNTAPRDNGKRTRMLRFRVSTRKLMPLYHLLYPFREKVISSDVLSLVGNRGAAWLWADGARPQRDGSCLLVRVGRSEREAFLLAGWLNTLLGVDPELDTGNLLPRLRLSPGDAKTARTLLRPCAPRSRYHLFTENNGHQADTPGLDSLHWQRGVGTQGEGTSPVADAQAA